MIMSGDKKKSVTLIMDKLAGKKPELSEAPMVDGAEQDDSVAVNTAAEELMSAFESKSPEAFVSAFKSLMELCQNDYSSEPAE